MKRSGLPANAFLRSQERDRVRPSSDRVTARAKATAQLLGHSTRSARAGDVGLISGALWFSACSAAPCTMPPSADRAGLCTVTRFPGAGAAHVWGHGRQATESLGSLYPQGPEHSPPIPGPCTRVCRLCPCRSPLLSRPGHTSPAHTQLGKDPEARFSAITTCLDFP